MQAVDAGRSMQGRGRWCRRGMGMGLLGALHVLSCLCRWGGWASSASSTTPSSVLGSESTVVPGG